ncbi:hypothetical protein HNQ96_004495 [Aminobacter lissarensis]|uniref:Uncharacterized protein n=1 Tax=Aminobacter carboxidus TaxID=376165 RepID=A0A8E1WJQ6_9HYPH|nr:hypothetical protein [Aminobacter lissarensis]
MTKPTIITSLGALAPDPNDTIGAVARGSVLA